MEGMDEIRRHYGFTDADEENLRELGILLTPLTREFADDFYTFILEDPYSASFFKTEEAVRKRKDTISGWYNELFTARYNNLYLSRLKRIGETHVRIGLKSHYVSSAMNFVRSFCLRHTANAVSEGTRRTELIESMNKAIDLHLDIMTNSYREAELKKVFLSYRAESALIQWSERLLQGLNLVLTLGLLLLALGVVSLFGSDIYEAFTADLQIGVIRALGSLLLLWMMTELLHSQIDALRGGKFHVRIFLELALVAFIRKLFVASVEQKDALSFGLLLGGVLIMGLILYLLNRVRDSTNP
jgi:uncharacterized membrane protein (DUF373 family)